ncbi:MAG: OmpH family outer membrane protein [Balneolaceae bacterium]|jgi:outer membrane protein|nr:MAG: OmpH family outer membrane protein [Balneolaceae bacterium]
MIKKIHLMVLVLLITAGSAYSQQHKVGYINPQAVLEALPEREVIERRISQLIQEKEQEYEVEIREFQEELVAFREASERMSQENRTREENRLRQKDQNLTQRLNVLQREIQQRQNELMQPLMIEIEEAIASVAKEQGLDYVLNQETGNAQPIIVFSSAMAKSNLDITQKVINKLTQ